MADDGSLQTEISADTAEGGGGYAPSDSSVGDTSADSGSGSPGPLLSSLSVSGPSNYPPSPDQPSGQNPAAGSSNAAPANGASPNASPYQSPPLKGIGGRLRGVLMGLAMGGVSGAVEGGVAPNATQTAWNRRQAMADARVRQAQAQATSAQQSLEFESLKSSDSHILALAQAREADTATQEHQLALQDHALNVAAFNKVLGITPQVQISGENPNDTHAQAIGAHQTLADHNGGTIPPVTAVISPDDHGDSPSNQTTFDIDVHAPNASDIQQNPNGYRRLVNIASVYDSGVPVSDEQWNTAGVSPTDVGPNNGMKMLAAQRIGQRNMIFAAQQKLYGVPTVSDNAAQNDATEATLQQKLDTYSARPDADPLAASLLKNQLETFTSAVNSKNKITSDRQAAAAAAQTKAEQAAQLPYVLAKTKAEEAVKDGDPNAAGQLLVSGDVAPSQIVSARKPAFAQAAFSAAKQINPNWNAQSAEGYFKVAGSEDNVKFFGSAKSLTDQNGTLDQLQTAYTALPNGKIPIFNKLSDWRAAASGSGATAGFAQTAIGVADDYAKVMGGGTGSDSARNEVLKSFSMASSAPQMAAAINAARQAVDSQMSSRIGGNPVLRNMYGQGMLIHVKDPNGGDHAFRTQRQADSFKKAAGIQ